MRVGEIMNRKEVKNKVLWIIFGILLIVASITLLVLCIHFGMEILYPAEQSTYIGNAIGFVFNIIGCLFSFSYFVFLLILGIRFLYIAKDGYREDEEEIEEE